MTARERQPIYQHSYITAGVLRVRILVFHCQQATSIVGITDFPTEVESNLIYIFITVQIYVLFFEMCYEF